MERKELEFSEQFGKIDEDIYLQKTQKVFTSEYSETNSLLREEEEDTKTVKSLLKKRSFDLKKEFPRKTIRKTKSLSNHFLVNIEELVNSVNGGFGETDLLVSLSPRNEEISFLSIDESSLPSERSSDITRPKHLKQEKLSSRKRHIAWVSGSVCPGEVLAIMGPSGGGKTTLPNLLSGRVKNNGGTVTYNDQLYTKSLKRR
ncbi:ABC transporter G family member 22 [Forsythia ovata]|uniref:ABC transporter G family member 22 n=1 Tax=Forsythia ovata TaxID=205694 RepID=A0ABD1PWE6_9LAMI